MLCYATGHSRTQIITDRGDDVASMERRGKRGADRHRLLHPFHPFAWGIKIRAK